MSMNYAIISTMMRAPVINSQTGCVLVLIFHIRRSEEMILFIYLGTALLGFLTGLVYWKDEVFKLREEARAR